MAAQEEIQRLRSRLEEREEQVHQAASAGLELLNQQVELQSRLDEQRVEMSDALEVLEQEKYSLQKDVELKTRMLESLQTDYECVKSQQRQQLQEQQEQQEHQGRSHNSALTELSNKARRLQSALEESQLNEKQLKHKLEAQAEALKHRTEELRSLSEHAQSSTASEVMELRLRTMDQEHVRMELEQNLQDLQYREQQLELTNRSLRRHLQQVTEEEEERQKEAVSCFNALEKSREVNRELQIQLDQVLQRAQDPNSRGSSLFAELEDKRAEMERRLLRMKVQHQSLQNQQAFRNQQLQRMKVQIASLMQLLGSRADPAQLERLHGMLVEKNREIQNLMTKLQRLEKVEATFTSQQASLAPSERADVHDATYYSDLLQMKLDGAVKDVERLKDELSLQRMKSLSESQRALELERKLFASERLFKQAQSEMIKLQIRVDELQDKYEPSETKKDVIRRKKKEKLPVDGAPPSEQAAVEVEQPDVSTTKPADREEHAAPPAEAVNATQGPEAEPRPVKCVRLSGDEPVVIPTSSSPVAAGSRMEETQQQNRGEERRRRRRRRRSVVEVMHVESEVTMENQCAQQ
ncbi:protein Spindly [Brachionichthys hirsutus]|uniref:protein Spindly n=1 Tax=Brachionichthys hirsutus TaxID=412623 RepID=UPI0036048D55